MTDEELDQIASKLSGKFKHYCYGGWDGLPVDETCGMEFVLCQCDHTDIAPADEIAQIKQRIRDAWQAEKEEAAFVAKVKTAVNAFTDEIKSLRSENAALLAEKNELRTDVAELKKYIQQLKGHNTRLVNLLTERGVVLR